MVNKEQKTKMDINKFENVDGIINVQNSNNQKNDDINCLMMIKIELLSIMKVKFLIGRNLDIENSESNDMNEEFVNNRVSEIYILAK